MNKRALLTSKALWSLAMALGVLSSCKGAQEQSAPAAPVPAVADPPHTVRVDTALASSDRIQVALVTKKALADQVVTSGSVVSPVDGEAKVGALVSGRLASVLAREGDRVKKGQVLAWLDAPEAARMQGDFLRAKARQWRAELGLEREKKLWETKATSERELQDAEAEVRAARAELEAARSMLATTRVPAPREGAALGASRIGIISPMDGVVSQRDAVVGGYYGPQDSLFDIVDPARLTIRADVPEVMARRLENGTPALIRPRGMANGCTGHVRARLERIDPVKRTMGVMVAVDTPCDGLMAGGFADVDLRLSASGAATQIVVPRSAIVDLDGAPSVFVQRGAGAYEVRTVRAGTSDGSDTVIEDGVEEGDTVVVAGAFLLKGEHLRAALGGE